MKKLSILVFLSFVSVVLLISSLSTPFQATGQTGQSSSNVASINWLTSITLGKSPQSIAVNDKTNTLYVGVNDSVLAIDGTTNQKISAISTGYAVGTIIVDSVNNYVFAVSNGEIFVINGTTNSLVSTIGFTSEKNFMSLAVDSQRKILYVGSAEMKYYNVEDSIEVFDEGSLTNPSVQSSIFIPGSASRYFHSIYVAVDSNLNYVYALWNGNAGLYVFNGDTHLLIKNFTLPPLTFTTDSYRFNRVDELNSKLYLNFGEIDEKTLTPINGFSTTTPELASFVFDAAFNLTYSSSPTAYGPAMSITNANTNDVFGNISISNLNFAVNTHTGLIYVFNQEPNGDSNGIDVLQGPKISKPLIMTNLSVNSQPIQAGPSETAKLKVQAGQSIAIVLNIRNLAATSVTYSPSIILGDSPTTQNPVQILPNQNQTIRLNITSNEAGNYNLSIEGVQISLAVTPAPSLLPAQTPETSPTTSPSVPEFSVTLVLPLAAISILGASIYRKKIYRRKQDLG